MYPRNAYVWGRQSRVHCNGGYAGKECSSVSKRTRSWHDAFRRPVTSSLGTVVGRHGGLLSGLPCTDRSNSDPWILHIIWRDTLWLNAVAEWADQIVSAWEHAIDPDGRLDCTRSFVSGIR